MRIFWICTFILLFNLTCSACIFKGNVIDSISKSNLPYVTIYAIDKYNNKIQGISNELGYFELNIGKLHFPLVVTFKSIGYKSETVVFNNCNSNLILLTKTISKITQVEVVGLSTKTIVEKCLRNLSSNLSNSPFNFDVFYRKSQLDSDNKFLYSTEYYSKLYQKKGSRPGIENIKTRVLNIDSKYYNKAVNEGNWEVMFMLSYELYITAFNKPRIGIITNKNYKKLNYKYLGEVEIESDRFYQIYYSGDSTKSDFRKGIILINSIDFGIVYFSSILVSNSKIISRRQFFYNKINDSYFLSHIKEYSNNPDLTFNNKILFTCNYKFDSLNVIDNNTKSLLRTSLKRDQYFENDSLFWKDFNYIPSIK